MRKVRQEDGNKNRKVRQVPGLSGVSGVQKRKPIFEDAGVTCPKCGGKIFIKRREKARIIWAVKLSRMRLFFVGYALG